MTILDLQRRIREAGRIRIGQQVPTQNGKTRPAKLDTFRITSPDRRAVEGVAELYGGEPQRWQAPSGPQWEVVTTSDELHVIVPPSEMAFSQWYETWSGGGCQRRCDGVTEQLTESPCVCDPDARECKPTTRLSVMLRDLAGLGVWRIESHGYYAAVELAGAVQVCMAAAGAGVMLPARLRLEPRVVKRQGEPTRNFAVPTLDVEITPAQLLGGGGGGVALNSGAVASAPALGPATPGEAPALPAPEPAAPRLLTPVPPTVEERPVAPVADQAAAAGKPTGARRAGAAASIPRTGLAPRTAAQAEAGAEPERGAPEGAAPLSGDDLEATTVAQLKLRCKRADLQVSGSKQELIDRLREGASGSSSRDEAPETGSAPPPPPHDEPDGDRPYDRDGVQKAFHARLRELGLDYKSEVKPWMVAQPKIGASLSKLPDTKLHSLLSAMEERPEQFVAAVREHGEAAAAHDPSAGDHGEGSPAEADPAPEVEGEPQVEAAAEQPTLDEGPSLQERAHAHAEASKAAKAAAPYVELRTRIHAAWRVLANADRPVYEASWGRVHEVLGEDPETEDWTGTNVVLLRREAERLEREVRQAKIAGKVR